MYVVDDAQFNVQVSDDLFVMSKPVGMTVLDYRIPDSVKDLGVESEEVDDIRKILPVTSQALPAIVAGEWTMRRRLFFFLNALCCSDSRSGSGRELFAQIEFPGSQRGWSAAAFRNRRRVHSM